MSAEPVGGAVSGGGEGGGDAGEGSVADRVFERELDAWGRRELHGLGSVAGAESPPAGMMRAVRACGERESVLAASMLLVAGVALLVFVVVVVRSTVSGTGDGAGAGDGSGWAEPAVGGGAGAR